MGWLKKLIEKLNPAQREIVADYGKEHDSLTYIRSEITAFEQIEVVHRAINLVVDSAAEIDIDIKDKVNTLGRVETSIRPNKLEILLNKKPNQFLDNNSFRRNLYLDLLLDGNAFIYFDGSYLYNLPAIHTKIVADKVTYISHYEYQDVIFYPNEIIHIKENSARSIYRGISRLAPTLDSINLLVAMEKYQEKFFKNNAIPGLILKTPNSLSQKVKDRIIADWIKRYNPVSGGRRPALLDGDMSIEKIGSSDFKELDFAVSIETQEKEILKAIGVPPILLDSGNNANITPNLRMFYINTVLPCVNKMVNSFEHFFGYDLKPGLGDILALQPDLKEKGAFYSSLVNNGIFTPNEAREDLRKPKDTDPESDRLRIPENIAGSASDSSQGGRPSQDNDNE